MFTLTFTHVMMWCSWVFAAVMWIRVIRKSERWATFKDRFVSDEENDAAKAILILRGWQPGREGTQKEMSDYPEFVQWLVKTQHVRPSGVCLFGPDASGVYGIDRCGHRMRPELHYVVMGMKIYYVDGATWEAVDARLKQMRCSYVRLLAYIDGPEFNDEAYPG